MYHLVTMMKRALRDTSKEDADRLEKWRKKFYASPWARHMETSDWCRLVDFSPTWREFRDAIEEMMKKYVELWVLAGRPPSYEAWEKYIKEKPVIDYWDKYNAAADAVGKKKARLQ